jgi:hypothetical protein
VKASSDSALQVYGHPPKGPPAEPPPAPAIVVAEKNGEECVKFHLQPPLKSGPKPEINVVPEYRGIEISLTHGPGNEPRVFMPLDNFQTGLKDSLIKQTRHLTKPASPIGDKAPFPQLPPDGVSPTAGGAAQLAPETKDHEALVSSKRSSTLLRRIS